MWLKEEKIFFSQTLNLKPEQQYTRDPVEHCLSQKLKFILMMTSGDFHEIFMMTGEDFITNG